MPEQLPTEVADESPAVRLVYKVLEADGPLTQSQLAEATALTTRTVRDAGVVLENGGLITSYNHPDDQRRRVYFVDEQHDSIMDAHQAFTKSEK